MAKCKKTPIIAVGINKFNFLIFNSTKEAKERGFNSSKIGLSIKNYRYSYKNYLWFNKNEFNELTYKKRIEIYNNKTRKKFSFLYKKCTLCKQEKSWLDYYTDKKYGKKSRCKVCNKKLVAKWAKKNREIINKKARERKYSVKRRKIDIQFRLRHSLRQRITNALNGSKKYSTIKYLGCNLSQLIIHLENQFKPGMSWENYGKWEIDHIYPLSKADLTNETETLKVCNYKNLQPLWKSENIKKSNKILGVSNS